MCFQSSSAMASNIHSFVPRVTQHPTSCSFRNLRLRQYTPIYKANGDVAILNLILPARDGLIRNLRGHGFVTLAQYGSHLGLRHSNPHPFIICKSR